MTTTEPPAPGASRPATPRPPADPPGAAAPDALAPLLAETLRRLRARLAVDLLVLAVPDRAGDALRVRAVEALVPVPLPDPRERTAGEAPLESVRERQEPLWIEDLEREPRWPAALGALRHAGIRSLCVVPLRAAERMVGAVQLGSLRAGAYAPGDLEAVLEALAPLAAALDREEGAAAGEGRGADVLESDRLRLLLEVTNALVAQRDLHGLIGEIARAIGRVLPADYASLMLHDPESGRLRVEALAFPQGTGRIREDVVFPLEGSPAGAAFRSARPLLVSRLEAERFPAEVTKWLLSEGIRSACWLPLVRGDRVLGVLDIASTQEDALRRDHVDLLVRVADQVAIAVENSLAFEEIAGLKDRLAKEKGYLEAEIRSEFNDEEIVGESPAWRRVLDEVRTVAASDANVLILGETGSGKELVARTIHSLSRRHAHTFVRICCPAVPSGLLESELFGHERGAYTGAITQKIGRFELAHQGSLFLDEIGDIPLELQPKLLRALEEHEFERLGSNRVIRVDARIIAATNRDLAGMVKRREFREDLYYRLNVVPIHVPPLRERREDIPRLARYFVQKFMGQMGKRIEVIPPELLDALTRWDWPGNVRELANLMERSVVLARGPRLEIPLADLQPAAGRAEGAEAAATLEDVEREEIRRVLRECHGVIAGPHGAAARLGLKRTTLNYKMKKLGIGRFD